MFEDNSSNQLNHWMESGPNQQSKINKGNKNKKIGKKDKKNSVHENEDPESESKRNLTKEQKREIQKEKNRMAAQLSRDRQKKYVQDLQVKVNELEKQIQKQLCRKCKINMAEHSTSEEEHEMTETMDNILNMNMNSEEPNSNFEEIIKDDPDVESLPFFRVPFQRSEMGIGRMNSFFCLFLLLLAVFCFSNSLENTLQNTNNFYKGSDQIARRVTQAIQVCQIQPIEETSISNQLIPQGQLSHWPFNASKNEAKASEKCKNQFWQSYLLKAQQQAINSYSKNLVNCNNPGLVHISNTIYQDRLNPIEEQWTFLITDPSITHAHISKDGSFNVDDVSYLEGVYQMVASKVMLKKVIGKNCLA